MKDFFRTLPRNIIWSFKGKNLLYHLLAIALTAILVYSGFDWHYFLATHNAALDSFLFPAIVIGMIFPVLVPLLILAGSRAYKNAKLAMTGWAVGQAAAVGYIVSVFYKSLTDRIPPFGALTDLSHGFRFSFFQTNVFWGWPSSHTTVAFAMAVALIALYPGNKALRYGAIVYALYIGIGVSTSIHWFSEFVAGAIIGSVIGAVVAKGFQSASSRT